MRMAIENLSIRVVWSIKSLSTYFDLSKASSSHHIEGFCNKVTAMKAILLAFDGNNVGCVLVVVVVALSRTCVRVCVA